jgi:MOSC domain-containing protein YiiM
VPPCVTAVASERSHRFSKSVQSHIILTEGRGAEGDAHAGIHVRHRYLARHQPKLPNLRQLHLIPGELFDFLRRAGYDIAPGELGENITTSGIELETLPAGTLLAIGREAVLELTGLRTPCALIDRFRRGLKGKLITRLSATVPFRAGVFATIRSGGTVAPGDHIRLTLPELREPLPRL